MRSLEKTATALGSLHVPVSAAAATTSAPRPEGTESGSSARRRSRRQHWC